MSNTPLTPTYLAYVHFSSMANKKDEVRPMAIIGVDKDSILVKASKYGSDPSIISPLFPLNKNWSVVNV